MDPDGMMTDVVVVVGVPYPAEVLWLTYQPNPYRETADSVPYRVVRAGAEYRAVNAAAAAEAVPGQDSDSGGGSAPALAWRTQLLAVLESDLAVAVVVVAAAAAVADLDLAVVAVAVLGHLLLDDSVCFATPVAYHYVSASAVLFAATPISVQQYPTKRIIDLQCEYHNQLYLLFGIMHKLEYQ